MLEPGTPEAPRPVWGQEVTVKMQCVLEDLTVVEKDSKLLFVIGEGDVNQVHHFNPSGQISSLLSLHTNEKKCSLHLL